MSTWLKRWLEREREFRKEVQELHNNPQKLKELQDKQRVKEEAERELLEQNRPRFEQQLKGKVRLSALSILALVLFIVYWFGGKGSTAQTQAEARTGRVATLSCVRMFDEYQPGDENQTPTYFELFSNGVAMYDGRATRWHNASGTGYKYVIGNLMLMDMGGGRLVSSDTRISCREG